MAIPKLKLKETPPEQEPALDWSQTRFAEPKPPTVLERFWAGAKRFLRVILIVVVILAAFLFTPFRRWDDYVIWHQAKDALIALNAQPDSLAEIQRVSSIASTAGIVWDQPNGPRPEKWHLFGQLPRYDASYGIIQVLALGLIMRQNESRGLKELERLQQRTSFNARPDLPRTDRTIETCTECKTGNLTKECQACRGRGVCSQCKGKGRITEQIPSSPFPLKRGLSGTANYNSRRLNPLPPKQVEKKCPQCNGTKKCMRCGGAGKSTMTCPTCGGKLVIIHYEKLPSLFQDSIKGTITIINKSISLKHAIHIAASLQQSVLGKARELSNTPLSSESDDTDFNNAATNTPVAVEAAKADSKELSDNDVAALPPLQKACENLQHTPLSKQDLQIVLDVVRNTTNSPTLRSAAMTAVALSRLLQGDTNAFIRASQIQKTTFPEQPQLLTITADDYTATCEACSGQGVKVMPCPKCMDPSTCPECNATGKIKTAYGYVPCEKCSHTEVCKMCQGKKQLDICCYSCKGSGTLFALSNNVSTNYVNVLSTIAENCRAN